MRTTVQTQPPLQKKRSAHPTRSNETPSVLRQPFFHLQRTIGNQAVRRIQAKLTVGAPDDIHEREADRVAEQVMRTPGGDIAGLFGSYEKRLQKKCTPCAGGSAPCAKCAAEEKLSMKRGAARCS